MYATVLFWRMPMCRIDRWKNHPGLGVRVRRGENVLQGHDLMHVLMVQIYGVVSVSLVSPSPSATRVCWRSFSSSPTSSSVLLSCLLKEEGLEGGKKDRGGERILAKARCKMGSEAWPFCSWLEVEHTSTVLSQSRIRKSIQAPSLCSDSLQRQLRDTFTKTSLPLLLLPLPAYANKLFFGA